jgi:hypothetical protein
MRQFRATVEHAVKTFLAELQETIASTTHKKYRLLLTKFKKFSTSRGYVMIDQWETSDVREFRTSWAINPRTGARRMAMLKPFFDYCVSNEWIMRNPAQAVKNPKGREMETAEQRLPFTDVELKKMYDACPKYGTTAKHKWTGDDVADFISLSILYGPSHFGCCAIQHRSDEPGRRNSPENQHTQRVHGDTHHRASASTISFPTHVCAHPAAEARRDCQ